jgi:hypothetical protein
MSRNSFVNRTLCLLLMAGFPAISLGAQNVSDDTLLERSQLSYRAEGELANSEAYGVIISCVKGQISVLTSVHNPRLPNEPIRRVGRLAPERYLKLWNDLERAGLYELRDNLQDEKRSVGGFSVAFNMAAGADARQFRAQGLALPESFRYRIVRSLIDEAAQVAAVWEAHQEMAADVAELPENNMTFEKLLSNLDADL